MFYRTQVKPLQDRVKTIDFEFLEAFMCFNLRKHSFPGRVQIIKYIIFHFHAFFVILDSKRLSILYIAVLLK